MRTRIGFYVHHEGRGHLRRAAAIIGHLDRPVSVLTSLEVSPGELGEHVEIVHLPPDTGAGAPVDPCAGGGLHWAPLAPDVLGPRAELMVRWLTAPDVAALVSDVSVEAALLARLCGVPTVVVRQNGVRIDAPHTLAHQIAGGILAPFPEALEAPETPDWVRDKSFYGGFLSSFPATSGSPSLARRRLGLDSRPVLLVLLGAGTHALVGRSLDDAARELPDWQVVVAGSMPGDGVSAAVRVDGWVADPSAHLEAADVVIGTAGSNVVADVAHAAKPLICVPEDRPFAEQRQRAERLADLGAAVTSDGWPAPGAWAGLVAHARAQGGGRLAGLAAGTTPEPTARWIEAVADGAATR